MRYAAACLLEEEVGDVAAAMDHLRLALEEPPELTFRPVLRALRLHAVETGSFWSALNLLDLNSRPPPIRLNGPISRSKRPICWRTRWTRRRGREVLEEALSQQPGHAAALLALEENTLGALGRGGGAADGALLQSVLERRLAGARSPVSAGACCAGWRCWPRRTRRASPMRWGSGCGRWKRKTAKASCGSWATAKASCGDPPAGARRRWRGRARGGRPRRWGGIRAGPSRRAGVGRDSGPERAGWLSLGAALARYRLGVPAPGRRADRGRAQRGPADPAPLCAMTSAALATGQWGKARLALDRQAELTRDRDWAATLQGLGAHIAELHEGNDDAAAGRYRRLLEARAAGSRGAGRAGAHRLPDRRRGGAGCAGRERRRSQR